MNADETGAAVVMVDHVTKDADSRGRFAIGGQAKLATITGAAYTVETSQPLGRGLRGVIVLRVAKDRPGYIRGHSGRQRASDRTQEAATAGLGTRMAELVAYVNEHPDGVRASEVAAALHMSSDDAGKYLRRACDGERITKPTRGLYLPARSMSEVSVCPILPIPESPPLSGGQNTTGQTDTSDSHLAGPDKEGTQA